MKDRATTFTITDTKLFAPAVTHEKHLKAIM